MENNYKYFEENGTEYRIHVVNDNTPDDPRNWSNLGTMVCWHKGYNLGDYYQNHYDTVWEFFADLYHNYINPEMDIDDITGKDLPEIYRSIKNSDDIVILPLYLYEHGGLSISISKFNDQWDSGQVGYIYATKENCECWYPGKNWKEDARERLISEVKVYNLYISDEVYGCKIDKKRYYKYLDTNEIGYTWVNDDSYWGYYSDKCEDTLLKEMCANIGIDFSTLHADEEEMEMV